jgi:NAD(P)H dehydrogenase (quinone)
MTILITGATGELGRMVIDYLLEEVPASELILVTRRPEKLAAMASRGAQVRRGDFDEPESLVPAFTGADKMLLISTLPVGRRIRQHRRAVNAAKKAGVKHIVYTSSVGINPKTPAIVVPDHMKTEDMIRSSGVAYTILRDSQYTEALAEFMAPTAVARGTLYSNAGNGKIAPVSERDCAACAAKVLVTPGHENRIYTITGPELLSYRDVASLSGEICGCQVEYVSTSDDQQREIVIASGVPEEYVEGRITEGIGKWSADDMVTYGRSVREGYFSEITDDVQKLLGRPATSAREVFLDYADRIRAACLEEREP